jgi:hypothetical protein
VGGKRVIWLAAVATVLALILLWILIPSEEDRIKRRIEEAVRAMEAEDGAGVLSIVDWDRFEDPWGHDVEDVERALDEAFASFDGIEVAMEYPRIVLEDGKKRGRVTIRFLITGRYEGQFGFIVGNMNEHAMGRLIMEKDREHGWRIVEVTAAVLPGVM